MRELTIAILDDSAETGRYKQHLVQIAGEKRDVKHFRSAENMVSSLSSSSVDILVALHPTWAMYDAMSCGVVLVTNQRNRYLWHMNNAFWVQSPAISDINSGIRHLIDRPQLLSTISKQAKRIHHRCDRRRFADSFIDTLMRAENSPKPKDTTGLYHQGVLKMSQGRHIEAMEDFKQSLELSGTHSSFIDKAYIWRQMAICYEKLKNPQAALSALKMSEKLALSPDDAPILVTRMRALASVGKHEEALSIFREIKEDDKAAPQVVKEATVIAASLFARLGDERYRRGDLGAAADAYQEASCLNPKVATYAERWERLRAKVPPPRQPASRQILKTAIPQPPPCSLAIPSPPLVSVIIPCYNDEDVIADSVQCALKQTVSDTEIIVVDDGSTDGTRRRLAAMDDERITVVYKRNGGPSSARNTALRLASKSNFVAFLDSDDRWEPLFLEKCIAALEDGGSTCGLAYCNSRLTHDGEFVEVIVADYSWDKLIDSWGMIPTGSFTIRHQTLTKVGPFNEEIERGEDLEWMWRVGARYEFAHVDEVLHHYCRRSNGQLSTAILNSRLLNACRSECLAVRGEGQGIAQ